MLTFKNKRQKMNLMSGFTIVELLIVIVVIAILATLAIVAYNGIQARAVAVTLQSDLSNASKVLKLYQVDNGYYPTSIDPTTYCPTPVDARYCLKPSSGNSFANYTSDNVASPQTFSLNAVSANGTQYYISEDSDASSSSGTFTMAAITGTARTGLTITAGALTPSAATVTRQWQRATVVGGPYTNISGATSNTYAIPAGDIGYFLRVTASGTGAYGGSVTSSATARVTTLLTAIAPISGTPTVGQILTAGARTPAAATVTYQWRSNGVAIAGATASTYTLTAAEQGTTITVTATANGNYTGTVTSAATAAVSP
jgi:prepilin-type N-terminal cleavage/methylation domain-containing protein